MRLGQLGLVLQSRGAVVQDGFTNMAGEFVLKVSRHCCWRERCLRGAHACKLKVEAYKKQAFPETFSERVSQVGVAE